MLNSMSDILNRSPNDYDSPIKVLVPTKNKVLVDSETEVNKISLQEKSAKGTCKILSETLLHIENAGFISAYDLISDDLGRSWLEDIIQASSEKQIFDWSYQFYQEPKMSDEFEKEWLSRLIFGAVEHPNVKLYLYEHSDYQDGPVSLTPEIKSFSYNKVQFKDHSISIDQDKFEFNIEPKFDLKKIRLLGGLYHDPDTSALYFSEEEEIRSQLRSLFAADKLKFKYKSIGFTVERDSLKSSVSYEESFFKNPLDKLSQFKKIMPEEMNLDLEIKEIDSEPMSLDFRPNSINTIVLYHPTDFSDLVFNKIIKIFIGIKSGLALFLGEEPAQIAINGPKRLNEIKLLKSTGFFVAILKIVMKADGKITADELWSTLTPFIKSQLVESPLASKNIDEMVSDHFKAKVFEAFDVLNDAETYKSVLLDENCLNKISFSKAVFGFIKPMLSQFESHYKEHLFYLDEVKEFNFNLIKKEKETALEIEFPFSAEVGAYMKTNICNLEKEIIRSFDPKLLEAKIEVKELDENESSGADWFDLDPKYYFNGVEITEEEARKFKKNSVVNYNGQLYYISEANSPVVKWLNYFWKRTDQKNNIKAEDSEESKEPSYYRTHVLDVLALRQAGLPVTGGEKWEKIAGEYDAIEKEVELQDKGFVGELKPFQKTGVSWLIQLYRLGLGGILADDMGLGKTIQVLSFFNHLKNTEGEKRFLVVVPTSLVYNWESEANKFAPRLSVESFSKEKVEDLKESMPDILVTTYGLLSEHQEFFKSVKWNIVIFDEAQQLKNIKSMRSEVSRNLESEFKICLSGTPMENHYGEYFSLVDLSVPGALGDHKSFMRVYGPRKVSSGQLTQSEVDYLKLKTKPLVLRRTKSQVLKELPEKTESVVKINFDEEQKEIYKSVAMIWNSKVQGLINAQGESKSQIQMFAALMKLRQICSCPSAIPEAKYNKISPKLSLVIERVEELIEAGNSVLVFTNFILTLDTLKDELKKRGINPLSITGKNSQKKREETLADFNTGGAKALLMTLKTGGVGLNLTKASYILHVEPWWNPAAENQGTDRAHRIGQTNNVHVYRYIMKNSIEEKIQELKKQKQEAFEGLLEKDSQSIKEGTFSGSSGLTKKDFEYLLS